MGGVLTGGSLTAATAIPAVAVAALKALVPPLVDVLAVPPAAPLLWSHARKVIPAATVPLKFAAGTKRTRVDASAASRRAAELLGLPKLLHVAPPLRENCHAPLLLSTPTT